MLELENQAKEQHKDRKKDAQSFQTKRRNLKESK
jgi:hypothetical protein